MRAILATSLLVVGLSLTACTTNSPHRVTVYSSEAPLDRAALLQFNEACMSPADEPAASKYLTVAHCRQSSIETTDSYNLFYVEFDEQGRLYIDEQYRQLFRYLEGRVNCGAGLSIVVFVHGWRHNAASDDENVALARGVLAFTAAGERINPPKLPDSPEAHPCRGKSVASPDARETIGIYIGWRGKSLGGRGLLQYAEVLSVFDRKDAAENVALGSVRELFSRLRVFQERQNLAASTCAGPADVYECKRVRMLIIGHSFGGLLVYNAISTSIMDSLSRGADIDPRMEGNCENEIKATREVVDPTRHAAPAPGQTTTDQQVPKTRETTTRDTAIVQSFADLVVLINPAFEGNRFEPLQQAIQRRIRDRMRAEGAKGRPTGEGIFCDNQRPILVIVTADNDVATKTAFHIFKDISSPFANTRPTGFSESGDADLREYVRHDEEYVARTRTIGHIDRFMSHTLDGVDASDASCAGGGSSDPLVNAMAACRCGAERWNALLRKVEETPTRRACVAYVEEINAADEMLKRPDPSSPAYINQRFCGGTVLTTNDPMESPGPEHSLATAEYEWSTTYRVKHSPIWIIRSKDKAIINNHSDINSPTFRYFVRQLYHDNATKDFGLSAFSRLKQQATALFHAQCSDL